MTKLIRFKEEEVNNEIIGFVVKNRELRHTYTLERGWGNGYVALPESHILHGRDYDEISEYVEVHGGLTFSGFQTIHPDSDWPPLPNRHWIVGFDTVHFEDTLRRWPKDAVIAETFKLKDQLRKITELK